MPSHINLVGAEIEMVNEPNREKKIADRVGQTSFLVRIYHYRLSALAWLADAECPDCGGFCAGAGTVRILRPRGLGQLLNTIAG